MISLVIPVYNDASLLPRCLTAIAAQTLLPGEVIVVDDGSEPALRAEFPISNTQFPITLVRQAHAGAAAARNRGAQEAHGDLLLFCDADVVLAPHALERLAAMLEQHPGASYAYSSFRFGWKMFRSFPFSADRLRHMPYIHTTALIRRAHFPGFDASLPRFQDWDLWLTMLAADHVGIHVPEVLFTIARTRGTMSRWLPSFAYRIPRLSRTRSYAAAMQRIHEKHGLAAFSTAHT